MKKFEELYKKYQNGTATREERAYIEEELKRAQEVTEMLNKEPQIAEPSADDVKKIKKTFKLKTLIVSLTIAVVSIVAIVAIVLGVIFGVAVPAAKSNLKVTSEQALEIAKAELSRDAEYGSYVRLDERPDRDLEIESPLKDSYYKWEIEIETDLGIEVIYHVSAKDGRVVLAHVDY